MGNTERAKTRTPHLIIAAMLICVYAFSPNYFAFDAKRESPFAGDFLQEWIGSYIVWNHDAGKLYDVPFVKQLQHDPQLVGFKLDEHSYFLMVYPPFYYVLLSPMAMLPYDVAAWIFAAIMVACLFGSARLMLKSTPDLKRDHFA